MFTTSLGGFSDDATAKARSRGAGGDIKFIETVPLLTTCIRNIDVVSTFVILNFLFCLIKLSKS